MRQILTREERGTPKWAAEGAASEERGTPKWAAGGNT